MTSQETKNGFEFCCGVYAPRFSEADAIRAHEEWGANCGPGALAAIMRMTLDEVRPHMGDFESKRYTNPTLMLDALRNLDAPHRVSRFRDDGYCELDWPSYGLARVQWEGPWTAPGVPIKARYRQTHWVGAARRSGGVGIFDINCMANGAGWASLSDWASIIVPYILKECVPRASGKWHLTHAIEVDLAAKVEGG